MRVLATLPLDTPYLRNEKTNKTCQSENLSPGDKNCVSYEEGMLGLEGTILSKITLLMDRVGSGSYENSQDQNQFRQVAGEIKESISKL